MACKCYLNRETSGTFWKAFWVIFRVFLDIVENDILAMSFSSPEFCSLGIGRYGTCNADTLYMCDHSRLL